MEKFSVFMYMTYLGQVCKDLDDAISYIDDGTSGAKPGERAFIVEQITEALTILHKYNDLAAPKKWIALFDKYHIGKPDTDIKGIISRLQPHTAYLVLVKHDVHNVEHEAILFNGFGDGGYGEVYQNSYDHPVPVNKLYSLKVVRLLTPLK